jgi:hypothetical protein
MDYRIKKDELTQTLNIWNELIPGRGVVRLVACGGTALTLMGYKESTKDVDFLVPELKEYQRIVAFLEGAGYRRETQYGWKREPETILFDLYLGKKVYVTELLTSPLIRGGSRLWRRWNKIEVSILNPLDLIISKMFRGTEVDIQDSLLLLARESIDLEKLQKRYRETAGYDIGEAKVLRNLELLLKRLEKEKRDGQ